eukprot:scaffold137258_cov20-Prasinocladus_malaysianus.AAC.1
MDTHTAVRKTLGGPGWGVGSQGRGPSPRRTYGNSYEPSSSTGTRPGKAFTGGGMLAYHLRSRNVRKRSRREPLILIVSKADPCSPRAKRSASTAISITVSLSNSALSSGWSGE